MPPLADLGRTLLAGALAAVVGVGGAAGDSPPGRWLPPIREFAPYPTTEFSVGVAPNGVAVVLRANVHAVSTTTKLGGGSWEKGTPFPDDLISPSIAVDDRGNALVTGWTLNEPADAPNSTVVAFSRATGSGTWTGPVVLSGKGARLGGPGLAGN